MDYDNHDLFVFILTFFATYAITFTLVRMFCKTVLGVS